MNENNMSFLTLATGEDRWELDVDYARSNRARLKQEGTIWVLINAFDRPETFVVLRPDVADWCWDNIGPYRIFEHIPSREVGPDGDDSWRIEFKTDTDMAHFKLRWM